MNNKIIIENYYNDILNKSIYFELPQKWIKIVLSGKERKQHIYAGNNRYLRKILKFMGIDFVAQQKALKDAKNFFMMYQIMEKLIEDNIPCYFFARPATLEKTRYSQLAQIRMNQKLDFPKMAEDYDKYEVHFKEILGKNASKEYVEELKKVPQVIKRGHLYGHKDNKSKLINVLNGRRLVMNSVENPERTIHIYGRCGAFGYAVDDYDNIPSLLQCEINEKSDNKIKVVNHGLWGSDDNLIINNLTINITKHINNDIVVLYQKPPIEEELKQFVKIGMHYFDCTQLLHEENSKYSFYDRVGHLNADGYGIVSRYIYKMMEQTEYKCNKTNKSAYQLNYDFITEYLEEQTSGEFQKNLERYLENIKQEYPLDTTGKTIGSIVMNCNPFTIGHHYLIEYASSKVDRLYVFILQEDKSFFKFEDRIDLVRKGIKDLKNVIVIPSGEFMISAMTFPEYFMKDYKKSIDFDATKDLHTFGEYIAKELDITVRFAGEEPIDVVTRHYNRSMEIQLPEMGIEFHEIPRKTVGDQQVISASKVRELMKENSWEEIQNYVPETTYEFLIKKYKK